MPPGQLRALARRIPVVAIAGRRDETDLDVVAVDNAAGMRALARHLIEDHGYRRLGFLAGPADSPDARERLDAFRQAIAGHPGCVLDPVLEGDFSEASGAAAARALRGLRPAPEVVACANDQMAIGMLLQLQESGAAIPGDMAVTGFDDIYASRVVTPPLTTVGQPVPRTGPPGRPPAAGPDRGPGPARAHRDPAHPVRDQDQLRLPRPGGPARQPRRLRSPRPDLPARRAPGARPAEGRTGCNQPSGCDHGSAPCLDPAGPGARPWPRERRWPRYWPRR